MQWLYYSVMQVKSEKFNSNMLKIEQYLFYKVKNWSSQRIDPIMAPIDTFVN